MEFRTDIKKENMREMKLFLSFNSLEFLKTKNGSSFANDTNIVRFNNIKFTNYCKLQSGKKAFNEHKR